MKTLLVLALLFFASSVFATDIQLTWDTPADREDGSKIDSIDRFNLYTTIDNVLQDVIEISGDATSFQLPEVKAGNYAFQISTVEDGQEGALSQPVTLNIVKSRPVRIELTVRVIE